MPAKRPAIPPAIPDIPAADPGFSARLLDWQRAHGRHDLPWQNTRDPYRIWVSEIMLQQTQVLAVIPYYARFMASFPDVAALAAADEDAVLRHWSGLGYYARARNLHKAAQAIVREHGGAFPRSAQALAELPGIGRSTAAAIAAFAWGERNPILDGNVKRVLARCFGVEGFPGAGPVEAVLWDLAARLLPERDIEAYTQGLMDLGATLCTRSRPDCARCPLAGGCVALRTGRTGELPTPRPKKASPTRQATWLVLVAEGQVLLERRPSAGLWGGLWTLPVLEEGNVAQACARRGCALQGERTLPGFMHTFTHFRLEVTPRLCKVARLPQASEQQPDTRWVALAQAGAEALPAPVKTLLQGLSW